ncbi:MAG: hypothetical protein ABF335_11405 [Alphaproteobacteria bacterium]
MTRISLLGAVITILALIVGTYELKYTVKDKAAKIASLEREIKLEQETIGILQTEWTYLTDPTRLESLAARHLDLEPLAASQWVVVGDNQNIAQALEQLQSTSDTGTADNDGMGVKIKASHKRATQMSPARLSAALRRVERVARKHGGEWQANRSFAYQETGTQIVSR